MRIETYKDLKNFLFGLTDSELEQPVKCWGEYVSGSITDAGIIGEDYINPTGEGVEPRSAYSDEPEYSDEPAVLERGTVLLSLKALEK